MLASEWNGVIERLARSVRELRRALGWSQQELASRAVLSQGSISRLESGSHPDVPLHSVVAIIRAIALEAPALDVPLTIPTQAFLAFCPFDGTIAVSLDPRLARLLDLYHRFPEAQQKALLRFVESTAVYLNVGKEDYEKKSAS